MSTMTIEDLLVDAPQITLEMRAAWAHEQRMAPQVRKFTTMYDAGLLTLFELVCKLQEVLAT